jgi:L-ascorbate metabolism protein UlaG (beta-lactamase superfamily)
MSTQFYLRPNIQAEPLFNRWYAWPLLISPATSSMITKNQHLRILESFVKSPEIHANSAKRNGLKGGAFMDYQGDVTPVQQYIDGIVSNQQQRLALTDMLNALQKMLDEQAKGMGVSDLYELVPEGLKGYVELGYDLNNRPSFRLIESLMYDNPDFYQPGLQSISLSLLNGDDRPFVLSTPRLETAQSVHLAIEFADARIERLFDLIENPADWDTICEIVGWSDLAQDKQTLLKTFFTTVPPQINPQRNYSGDGVQVRYFGHATVLIETSDVTILTDPVVSYAVDAGCERLSYQDLPEQIDYVVLTHNHQDHIMFETLLQIRAKVKHWVVPHNSGGDLQDPSIRLMMEQLGFDNVIELNEMQKLPIVGGAITGLPFLGEHGDLQISSKLAYHIKLKDKSVLCMADSNNLEPQLYRHIQKITGDVDCLFIGMECEGAPMSWLYGPLFTYPVSRKMDRSRRLNGSNCDRALKMIEQFNPSKVFIYAMGAEPWLSFISSIEYSAASEPIIESDKLLAVCEARKLPALRLYGKHQITV